MIAAVAEHVRDTHDSPAFELAQAVAHVGAGHRKHGGDMLGRQGLGREVEQRMDLRNRAIDPQRAPISPQWRMKRC